MTEQAHNAEAGEFVGGDWLDELFPFHVVFDVEMRVRRWGRSLPKLCGGLEEGVSFQHIFEPRDTRESFEFERLKESGARVVFAMVRGTKIGLRGTMRLLPAGTEMLFLCGPWFGEVEELGQLGLAAEDFAAHDSSWELLAVLRERMGGDAVPAAVPVLVPMPEAPSPEPDPSVAEEPVVQNAAAETPTLAANAPEPKGRSTQFNGLRFILAEDNHINRRFCLEVLKRVGVAADTVENGEEVVERVSKGGYDVVLMDCQMPVMDGLEATRRIRALEAEKASERRVLIIALTANAMLGDREKCLRAGMDDYVAKPFSADQLIEVLKKHELALRETEGLRRRLEELSSELEVEVVCSLVSDFIVDLPFRVHEVEELMEGGGTGEVERLAHSLKGVAHTFGLRELGGHFAALEEAADAGQRELMVAHLAAIHSHLPTALRNLKVWLKDKGTGREVV